LIADEKKGLAVCTSSSDAMESRNEREREGTGEIVDFFGSTGLDKFQQKDSR
jgi:hypothetical protein